MFEQRTVEQATVHPDFTRIATTPYWSEDLARLDVASIARLQRMMCNHGMEVIGDTSPALHRVMGVNRGQEEATFSFKSEVPEIKPWKRRVVLDDDDADWEKQFYTPSGTAIVPESGVDTGLSVNTSHTPPELSVFAELPQAVAIKAAGRVASRQMDENLDPAPYLDQFERWWGMPNGFISNVLHKTTLPISVPRLLAAGGKSSSPVYGVENYSGLVRFLEPSVTRERFELKEDREKGNEIAVDFSHYRSAIRWVMSTALQVPGKAKEQISEYRGLVGFNLDLRARVVVPQVAMNFNIPTLAYSAKPANTFIVKETKRAIENAMDGRTAVIAGLILKEGELLISKQTRDRMGKIRDGKKRIKFEPSDVKEVTRHAEVYHAQAGVGLYDFCINMLGANEEHITRSSNVMGRISGLVEQKHLNACIDHCLWLSCLWDASFKNTFQRMCQMNSTTMDDFVSSSPEEYPYDAKIAFMLLRNRIGTVIKRIKVLESLFVQATTYNKPMAPLVKDVRKVLFTWAAFYAGKAKTTKVHYVKVRAQVLSAFYSTAMIEGDQIAFPDLRAFFETIVYKYARRGKREQLDYPTIGDVDDLVKIADGEYNPEYKFTKLLQAVRSMTKMTISDLVDKSIDMEVEDEYEEKMAGDDVFEEENMDDLLALEATMDFDKYDVDEEMKFSNLRGPKAMKAQFYAICMMGGSEKDFLARVANVPFKSFEEWHKSDPVTYLDGFDDLCRTYETMISEKVDEEDGEADVL